MDAEKDAARYRWLRAADWDDWRDAYWATADLATPEQCADALDAFIDGRIAEKIADCGNKNPTT